MIDVDELGERMVYFFSANVDVLLACVCEANVDEERRGGEEVGVDLGDGLSELVLLVWGEWNDVFDFVERHFEEIGWRKL